MANGKQRMMIALVALVAWSGVCWAQEGPTVPVFPQGQVTGTLPVVLKLHSKSASVDNARLASMGPRQPSYVAPSAQAYGHAEYSALPPYLSFYAGLNEKPGPGSRARLSALDVRFAAGPAFLMALDTTRGEVLVSPGMARKQHLNERKGAPMELPPFRMGTVAFTGVPARMVKREDLPGDSVDGVLPLMLFNGYRILWEPKAGRLALSAAASPLGPAYESGAFAVPCKWLEGALCLEATLEGHVTGLMLVDSASRNSVLDLPAVEQAGLAYRPWGDVRRNEILKGGVVDRAHLKIGSADVTLLSARVVEMGKGLPPGCLGILGQDILNLFAYAFEPGGSSVVLTPHRPDGKS